MRCRLSQLASHEGAVDIAALGGLGIAKPLFEAVRRYRDHIDELLMNEAKIADVLTEDFRWLMGMKEALNTVLAMPAEAAKLLQNEERK